MLSMRTKTTVVWAKAIPFPLLALSTFVVLTSRAVFGAHPEVLQPRTGLASGGFLPPGIDMVKFCVDYDAVYSVEKFVYGPENQLECASVFWPNLGSFAAISGPNDAVVLVRGRVAAHMALESVSYRSWGSIPAFWGLMDAYRGWNRDEYRDSLWSRLMGTVPNEAGHMDHDPPLCNVVLVALAWLFFASFVIGCAFVHVMFKSLLGWPRAVTVRGWAPCTPARRAVHYGLFWCMFLGQLVPTFGVCNVCQGFYAGCDGGTDGNTCKGAATVAANVTAMATAGVAAIKLAGLFDPRVLRVFTTTVLALIKRYKSMPVAGTPYDFAGKSNSEIVADVIAGKVSKGEALVQFSEKIEAAAALAEADGRASKTLALETQIKLLGAMDEKPSHSTAGVQMMGVHRFVWAKCSEVVLGHDPSKITVGSSEKETTAAQSAKIHTPKSAVTFLETLNLWHAIEVQTGLAPLMVVFEFTQRVVYLPMRDRHESWMLAHELLLAYLDKVDQSPNRSKTLANVFDKEGVDAMKDEAAAAAVARFGRAAAIFRHTGGTRVEPAEQQPYNGKSTPSSSQPCLAWNKDPGSPQHKDVHLHADGTCKFRHRCGKFIKLASGQIGYCFRDHSMSQCDRKPEEISDVGPSTVKRV